MGNFAENLDLGKRALPPRPCTSSFSKNHLCVNTSTGVPPIIYAIILYFVQPINSMQQTCLCSYLTACDPKHYGENCTETCTCPSNRCNPITGECNCAPGKQDPPDCSKNCTSGAYGLNCRGTCDCQNEASCDPVNGACYCRDGFQADKCQHEVTTTNTITTGKIPTFFASLNYKTMIYIAFNIF